MPHFQVYSFTSKSLGDLELNFAALYLQLPSSNFPSLGFSLPRAMSTDIRRPHRLRTPPRRAEPGRTRRSGVQGAGVARPHAQPRLPLATKHPRGTLSHSHSPPGRKVESGSRSAQVPPIGGAGWGGMRKSRAGFRRRRLQPERVGGATRSGGFGSAAGDAARCFVFAVDGASWSRVLRGTLARRRSG